MNNTIGGFTTDREWVLDKNTKEDIVYLDDYAKEHSINIRTRTIGISDIPNFQRRDPSGYNLYKNMLQRGYSHLYLDKEPTYEFVSIERDFHIVSKFISHINSCYKEEGWHMDKDFYPIQYFEEKSYSKRSILFLPQYLNNLFTSHDIARGNLPLFVIKSGSLGVEIKVSRYIQNRFTKYFTYSNYPSKEEALLRAFTKGIEIKILEVEKHIDNIKLMPKTPQEWKDKVILGLTAGIDKYNILLKEFNAEDYSQYL